METKKVVVNWLSLLCIIFVVAVCTGKTAVANDVLEIEHISIRQDRYTVPVEQWQWGEAWPEIRQYFPRYFKPSATLHMFVKNTSNSPVDITKLSFNDKAIEDVCTKSDFAGPVIWYRSNPEVLAPGKTGMIYVRLRQKPTAPVKVGISISGQMVMATFDEKHNDKIRFGYVGYNKDITKAYVYVEKWTEKPLSLSRVFFDGLDVTSKCDIVNPSFKDGPALIEISFDEPLEQIYHCIKVATKRGISAMSQVRARDDRFYLGIIGGNRESYYKKFFNTTYHMNGIFSDKPNWWDPNSEYAKLGFTLIMQAPTKEAAAAGSTVPVGKIIYTGIDEPDAHEGGPLPYMDRLGINAMRKVEPPMRLQRRLDPNHDTMVLVNRTYAPMNWLTYGEMPDVLTHDCYAPTHIFGYDMSVFPPTMQSLINAVAPRPYHMMLWANLNTGYPMRRSSTPEENDMAVHYTIAGGAKGVHYFLDWNSYRPSDPKQRSHWVGAPRMNMLWKNMGRMNAEITRMASLLSRGYPYQVAKSDNDMLYTGSLLCGKDTFIIVLVNRNHRIHPGAGYTKRPYIYPVKDATVKINFPKWFNPKSSVHVTYDNVKPVKLKKSLLDGSYNLAVKDLKTSMVIVVSQDGSIAEKLTLPARQYAAMIESEKPVYVTNNPPIANVKKPGNVIKIRQADIDKGSLELDLTDSKIISQASTIETHGTLILEPGKWLGLLTDADTHGRAEIVFTCEVPVDINSVKASLSSLTPNFGACANNVVGLSLDGINYAEDCSFNARWNGGYSHELLNAAINSGPDKPIRKFFVRVLLRDPGIVKSDDATNLAYKLNLSWTGM